jgi:hypothetical protein
MQRERERERPPQGEEHTDVLGISVLARRKVAAHLYVHMLTDTDMKGCLYHPRDVTAHPDDSRSKQQKSVRSIYGSWGMTRWRGLHSDASCGQDRTQTATTWPPPATSAVGRFPLFPVPYWMGPTCSTHVHNETECSAGTVIIDGGLLVVSCSPPKSTSHPEFSCTLSSNPVLDSSALGLQGSS